MHTYSTIQCGSLSDQPPTPGSPGSNSNSLQEIGKELGEPPDHSGTPSQLQIDGILHRVTKCNPHHAIAIICYFCSYCSHDWHNEKCCWCYLLVVFLHKHFPLAVCVVLQLIYYVVTTVWVSLVTNIFLLEVLKRFCWLVMWPVNTLCLNGCEKIGEIGLLFHNSYYQCHCVRYTSVKIFW